MSTNAIQRMSHPSASTATGAHLFQSTKGNKRTGGVGGISHDPATWGGRAVIEGTRIPVFVIVDQYEAGGMEGVRRSYPELKAADVFLALAYADLDESTVAEDRDTYLDSVPDQARIG